jgi:hypothetical protein
MGGVRAGDFWAGFGVLRATDAELQALEAHAR